MTRRRVLGIGLDPYTIDFDTSFFRGKPLNADVIAGGIKADEVRIRAMGHDCIGASGSRSMQSRKGKAGMPTLRSAALSRRRSRTTRASTCRS